MDSKTNRRRNLSCNKPSEEDVDACMRKIKSICTLLIDVFAEISSKLIVIREDCDKNDTSKLPGSYGKLCRYFQDVAKVLKTSQNDLYVHKNLIQFLRLLFNNAFDDEDFRLPLDLKTESPREIKKDEDDVKDEMIDAMGWQQLNFDNDNASSLEQIAISESTSEASKEMKNKSAQPPLGQKQDKNDELDVKNEMIDEMGWQGLDFGNDNTSTLEQTAISESTSEALKEKKNKSAQPQKHTPLGQKKDKNDEIDVKNEMIDEMGWQQLDFGNDNASSLEEIDASKKKKNKSTQPEKHTPLGQKKDKKNEVDVKEESVMISPEKKADELNVKDESLDWSQLNFDNDNVNTESTLEQIAISESTSEAAQEKQKRSTAPEEPNPALQEDMSSEKQNELECSMFADTVQYSTVALMDTTEVKFEEDSKSSVDSVHTVLYGVSSRSMHGDQGIEDNVGTCDEKSCDNHKVFLKFPVPVFIQDSPDDFDISNSNLPHLDKGKEEDSKNSGSDRSFQIKLSLGYVRKRFGELAKKKSDLKSKTNRLNQSKCILSASSTDVSDKSDDEINPRGTGSSNTHKGKNKLSSTDLFDRKEGKLTSDEIVRKYLTSLPDDRSTLDGHSDNELTESACNGEMIDNIDKTYSDDDYEACKKNSDNDNDTSKGSNRIHEDISSEQCNDENKDLPTSETSLNIVEATPSDKETCLPNIEDAASETTIPNPTNANLDIDDSSDNENLLVPLFPQTLDLPDNNEVIQETPIEEDNASDNENLLIPLVPANPQNDLANEVETDKSSDNEELLVPIIDKENYTVLESKDEPDPLNVIIDCSDSDDKSSEGDLLMPLINGVDSSSDNENRDESNKGTDLSILEKIQWSSDSDISNLFSDSEAESDLELQSSLRRKRRKSREQSSISYDELVQECKKRKCRVLMVKNKIYDDVEMAGVKIKSQIKRLFNRSDASSTSSSLTRWKGKRMRKTRPLTDSSDSDSSPDGRSSSSGTIPYDCRLEIEGMNEVCNTEDMDENDIFNNIRDSDDSSIKEDDDEDDDDEDEEEVNKKEQKAKEIEEKTKKDKTNTKNKEVSAWRKDPLLRRIDFSSDSESEETKEAKQKKDEASLEEKMRTIFKEENYFSVDSFDTNTGDESSDCEFVSFTKNKRKRKRKSSGESDEVETNEENDDDDAVMVVDDGSPKKGGRKNIRAVKSAQNLEKSTKLAAKEEEEHESRLQEKRKKMDEVLTQSGLSQDSGLFLDATEGSIIEVDENLGKRLKTHQVSGVQFMWDACYESVKTMQEHSGSGCILAHCMGLGKTFQVITLIHTLFKHPITNTKHVLVVCPLSIVKNWKNEFNIAKEHAKDDTKIDVRIISGNNKELRTRIQVVTQWKASGGVLVMGYETYICLTKDQKEKETPLTNAVWEALVDPGPDLIVCDEGHQLKNNKTMRTKALMRIKTRRRIILTGTPLQNNLSEYYHMVQFVKPNLLGTYTEYTNRFVNPISNGQYDDSTLHDILLMKKRSHVLHSILTNTIQRYEVSELERYLPKKLDFVLFVPLHPFQAAIYKSCIEVFQTNQERRKLFSHFNILQAIWTHPAILHYKDEVTLLKKSKPNENQDEELSIGWWKHLVPEDCLTNPNYGPKFKIMLTIIKECEKIDDKLLIFSSYIAELNAIEAFLKHEDSKWTLGVNYLRMDGNLPPDQRQEFCNQFNKKKSNIRLFLITHKVGGLGLNLAAANRVILMDVCWNPSFDSQSIFRAYRFGQHKQCYVYRLVSMGTMEEVIYERSVTKQAVAGRVVDEMQITRHYKSHEVSSMYRCNVDITEERPCPKVPEDDVLAGLLQEHTEHIFKYHEHESLLRNRPDEELDEEQAKTAWEEYNKEKEALDHAANSVYNPVGLQSFVPRPILNDINNIPGTSSTYFSYNNQTVQQHEQDNPITFKIGSKIVTAAVNNVAITNKTNPQFIQNASAVIRQLRPQINALQPPMQLHGLPRPMFVQRRIVPINVPKKWAVRPPGSPRRRSPTCKDQVSPIRLEKVIDLEQLDMLKQFNKNTDITLTTVINDAEPSTSTSEPPARKKNDIIEID